MSKPEDLAADAIVTLMYHGVIQNNRSTIDRIKQLIGMTQPDLAAARNRLIKRSYKPFDIHKHNIQTAEPDTPQRQRPAERPAGMRPAAKTRQERVNEETGTAELWCTGHDGHQAHWAPEDEFMRRADRPHLRHTHCDDGRRSYQRARRVSLRALDDISAAGLALNLDEDSNLVGLVCKYCGQPFRPGDDIEGEAALRHSTCPEAS